MIRLLARHLPGALQALYSRTELLRHALCIATCTWRQQQAHFISLCPYDYKDRSGTMFETTTSKFPTRNAVVCPKTAEMLVFEKILH